MITRAALISLQKTHSIIYHTHMHLAHRYLKKNIYPEDKDSELIDTVEFIDVKKL